MPPSITGTRIVLTPMPPAHFGAGAIDGLAGIVRGAGADAAVIVTDQGLTATTVVSRVTGVLTAAGLPATVFSEVHPNPTTGDVAAGADAVTALIAAGAPSGDHRGGRRLPHRRGQGHRGRRGQPRARQRPGLPAHVRPACLASGGCADHRGHRRGNQRLAEVAFAFGAGDTAKSAEWNAGAAVEAITGLAARVGLTGRLPDFGVTPADFPQISADALDDEVLVNTPRLPTAADIESILADAHG